MPRLNLLPYRAAARIERGLREVRALAAGMAVLLCLFVGAKLYADHQIDLHQAQLSEVMRVLAETSKRVEQVEASKAKAAGLARKLAAIEVLKQQKQGPAHLLSDLADILTAQPKVWLTGFEDQEGSLTLKGGAMEQSNISSFVMALEKQSSFFQEVSLSLINAANEGSFNYFQWTVLCRPHYGAS